MHPLRSRRLADQIHIVCRQPHDHGFGSSDIVLNAIGIQQQEPAHTVQAGVVADLCRPLLRKDPETVREVPLSKRDLLNCASTLFEGNASPHCRRHLFPAVFAIIVAVVTTVALRIW